MAQILLSHVTVQLPIYSASQLNLKGAIRRMVTRDRSLSEPTSIHALDDVTTRLDSGARVALIGANGAGKTTLLRVLAGILPPTEGERLSSGSIAPLFDAGLGFDFEATGRENIVLRGMALGHDRRTIEPLTDSIIAFSELGPRIEHPVRTYSSGMTARLAFSIATAVPSEILLVDEGFGTADASFAERAAGRLDDFIDSAGLVVLASHSPMLLQRYCTRGIVLVRGRLAFDGTLVDALDRYSRVR